MQKTKIAIIGGGLAGLCAAIHLGKHGIDVILFEKDPYPRHKVCGEFVSNEILPYLRHLNIDPFAEGAVAINKLQLSSTSKKLKEYILPLGGFSISRYSLDNLLFKEATVNAAIIPEKVTSVEIQNGIFTLKTESNNSFKSDFVLGAFGKRSNLDAFLKRRFFIKKSAWLAVKAHYEYEMKPSTVAVHTFDGGYCGLSEIENGMVNMCYLATYHSFKKANSIESFQNSVLSKNETLRHFFSHSKIIFEKPLTIGQISFGKKRLMENHIFMIGDSAGMIHPLCGNGMAMAIHSAKLFSELFINSIDKKDFSRANLEKQYIALWNKTFQQRMRTGKWLQKLLLNTTATNLGIRTMELLPSLASKVIKQTHGKPIV